MADNARTPGGVTPAHEAPQPFGQGSQRSHGAEESGSPVPPPADLGERGRAVWEQTVEGLDFRPDELAVLVEFCHLVDECASLRDTIREQGLSAPGSKGQPRPNPLLASLAASRALLLRYAAQLAIPDPDEEVGQTPTSKRAQHAARARWAGHVPRKEFRSAEA